MPHDFSACALHIDRLGYRYCDHPLFSDLNYQLVNGDMLLVTGGNGSGKSTLLRLLTGLMQPIAGTLYWNNIPIQDDEALYHANVHYISHHNGLKASLTVLENIRLMLALQLTTQPSNMNEIISTLSLSTLQHSPVHQLSAGQQRRVALAKLLLIKKPVWILDEPLTSLDALTQDLLQEMINNHLENGGMAIASSHHTLDKVKRIAYHLKMTA